MSQPPQPRPWFRLASLARPAPPPAPAPAPAPAPTPRPPLIRPTFTQSFVPPPPTQPVQPPPPPPPPLPQPSVPPTSPPLPVVTSPAASPETATPPPSSPPSPPPASPPSPATPPRRTAIRQPSPPPTIKPSNNISPKPSPPPPPPPSSVPQSPKPRLFVPSSSLPTKPISPPPPPPPTAATNAAREPTSISSSQMLKPQAKTPSPPPKVPSPIIKPLIPPPSPLKLPPPQIKSDHEQEPKFPPESVQKIVMVHENIEKPKAIPREIHNHSPNLANHGKKDKGNHQKKLSDSEEFGMKVITLAGENKGAIMELSPIISHKKHGFVVKTSEISPDHKNGNKKSWSDGEKSASDTEWKMKSIDKNQRAMANSSTTTKTPFHAYTNSNVQGVNNSILYNCSCTHHDPGVHLSLSRKAADNPHRL